MKRLLLFDIDGTLLSTGGAARRTFQYALERVYGTSGPIDNHPFNGKTDPQIARELLRAAGLDDQRIDVGLPELYDTYVAALRREMLMIGYRATVYPGVRELLTALSAEADAVLGLLTGNVESGADLKLSSAGLRDYFSFGVYGSDCEQRVGLPPIAVERAHQLTGRQFEGTDIVIIGDTPHDVRCGEVLGSYTVGVTTGGHSRLELEEAGAHAVFDDFTNTASVLRVLLGPV